MPLCVAFFRRSALSEQHSRAVEELRNEHRELATDFRLRKVAFGEMETKLAYTEEECERLVVIHNRTAQALREDLSTQQRLFADLQVSLAQLQKSSAVTNVTARLNIVVM